MPTTNGNDLAKIACHIIGNSQLSSESRTSTQMQMPILMHLCSLSSDPLLWASPPPPAPPLLVFAHIFICQVFNGFDRRATEAAGSRQQLKRQRHRLVRGVKLAGILGLRQVQINNDNRHQTADNSHQTTTTATSRCCTLCKQRDPQTEDQTQTQSHHRQSEAQSKHQIDLSIRWKTAKVAHTFRWHLKVIWIYAATYIYIAWLLPKVMVPMALSSRYYFAALSLRKYGALRRKAAGCQLRVVSGSSTLHVVFDVVVVVVFVVVVVPSPICCWHCWRLSLSSARQREREGERRAHQDWVWPGLAMKRIKTNWLDAKMLSA